MKIANMKSCLSLSLSVMAVLAAISGVQAEPIAKETDLVVVGAGGAGLTATLTAAQGGAKVVLLEKNAFPGGTSLFAEGIFAVETPMQIKEAYLLTKDEAFKHEMAATAGKANARLLRAYINESDKTFEWLVEQGVPFEKVSVLPPDGLRTWHLIAGHRGEELVRTLYYKAKANPNVTIMMETPAKDLTFDAEHHVTGLLAQAPDGTELTIKAKAVVMATGGFGEDLDMVKQYTGDVRAGPLTGGKLKKAGFGVKMAQSAGAVLEGMEALQFFPMAEMRVPPEQAYPFYMAAVALEPFNVFVNTFGMRFVDEMFAFDFSRMGNALDRQHEKFGWAIMDQALVDKYTKDGPEAGVGVLIPARVAIPDLQTSIDKAIKAGNPNIVSADSFEKLAAKMQVPADALKKSLSDYNRYAETNYDVDFAKEKKYLHKMSGRLYAVKIVDFYLNTLGGARVNDRLQPLDANDQVIPHLYMTGNDVGGLYGDTYPLQMSGGTYGFAVNSGRLAAIDFLKSQKR